MLNPQSPETVALIKEFLTVFEPLQISGMSIPRVLIYDYVRYLYQTYGRSDLTVSSNLTPIAFSNLQTELAGPYPLPQATKGYIYIEGPISQYILPEYSRIIKRGTLRRKKSPGAAATSAIYSILNDLLKIHKSHPIFSQASFDTWIKGLLNETIDGLNGTMEAITKFQPSCIVFQENNYLLMLRVLSEAARACRITSVAYHPLTLLGTSESAYIYRTLPLFTSYYFCWGKEYQDWMSQYGVPKERVLPVGCPRFDRLGEISSNPQKIRATLNLKEQPFIVLADQQTGKREAIFRMIWETLKNQNDIVLVVKLHPHHEGLIESYRRWSDADPRVRFVPPFEITLAELLSEAVAVVTYFSTVGVEAAFFKTPVITPLFEGNQPSYQLDRNGGAIPVNTSPELAISLQRLINDPEYKSRILKEQSTYLNYVTIPDQNSTVRFLDTLISLTSK